jgi:hypothetical protein
MKHFGTRQYLLGAIAIAGLSAAACGGSSTHSDVTPVGSASTVSAPPATPSTSTTADSTSGSPAVSVSTTAVSDSSASTPITTSSPASTNPTVVVRACTSDQVTTTYTPVDRGAGQAYLSLLFTNSSQAACTLQGYPGAAGLNSSGHQIAQAVRTPNGVPTPPPTVLLQPNTVASATIHATDVGQQPGDCAEFASLLVTPPNTTRSVPVTEAMPSCDFEVHPVVAGSKGSNP